MSILIIFGTIILIVAVCLGMDKLFHYEEGEPLRHQMLLHWFRKQVYLHEQRVEKTYVNEVMHYRDKTPLKEFETIKMSLQAEKERKLNYQFYLKPFFLCVKCMPSVWGSLTFIILNGISCPLLPYMILCDIISVGIITLIVDRN